MVPLLRKPTLRGWMAGSANRAGGGGLGRGLPCPPNPRLQLDCRLCPQRPSLRGAGSISPGRNTVPLVRPSARPARAPASPRPGPPLLLPNPCPGGASSAQFRRASCGDTLTLLSSRLERPSTGTRVRPIGVRACGLRTVRVLLPGVRTPGVSSHGFAAIDLPDTSVVRHGPGALPS